MSRQTIGFRTFSLVILVAGISTGCETIYSDVYSPRPNRFVAPVEQSAAVQLPTETETTILPPSGPVEIAPAPPVMPEAAPEPSIPGLEPVPGMEAAPADPAMGADPAMDAAPADPAMGMQ